ncbi:hypothetical protein [Rhizobium sp. Leaf383]|uniref:hypothetical protein n=1 Tax=Rhizobium sp. Leaf383 TaxID=1736357 RepID=UPI000AF69C04|nr:hypothetical protein [Rhizobium sp. Leaf383]
MIASKDGEHFYLDWCLSEYPWEYEPQMEALLASNNPFRPVSEKMVDGYYFVEG